MAWKIDSGDNKGYRYLDIDEEGKWGAEFRISADADGVLRIEAADMVPSDNGDGDEWQQIHLTFEKETAPDVVMALQAWLGSL